MVTSIPRSLEWIEDEVNGLFFPVRSSRGTVPEGQDAPGIRRTARQDGRGGPRHRPREGRLGLELSCSLRASAK